MSEQMSNVKFVREIEKRPALYNFDLADYTRRDVTDKAWSEVAKICGLSVPACKDKWKNLRTVFVRHVKAPPGGKRKQYYLNETMKFILPYVKTINSAPLVNNVDALDEPNEQLSNRVEPKIELTEMIDPVNQGSARQEDDLVSEVENNGNGFFHDRHFDEGQSLENRRLFLLSLMDEVGALSDEQMRQFRRRVFGLIDDIIAEYPANNAKRPRNEVNNYYQ